MLKFDVSQKPKKDSDRMKHDSKTHIDKQEIQIGMTANHTNRPDKILFFADPHFLFLKSHLTLHTLASRTCRPTNQSLPKSANRHPQIGKY